MADKTTTETSKTEGTTAHVLISASVDHAIHVTNAQAGAVEFAGSNDRAFNYYTPKGRYASVYEDVTVDVQPQTDRWIAGQGWLYSFADGTQGFDPKRTKIKSSDWNTFRDPNEDWERPIYIRQANEIRQLKQNLANAKSVNAFEHWDKSWVKAVETHVCALAHAAFGLGMHVFVQGQRDAMSNMINNAICVNSMDKLRTSQDLVLYNLELSEIISGFDGSAHKTTWLNDPAWQGTRENVERITATADYLEQVFAVNLIYEPLVEELFRSHFVMQFAPSHGDFVTPTLIGIVEGDYQRNLNWTTELFRILASDPQHEAENKRVIGEWLAKWTPISVAAARLLQPIWSQPKQKVVRFEDSYDRAKHRFESNLSGLGLQLPKEVKL